VKNRRVQKPGFSNKFADREFFDACDRLSLMVGQRNITVLLAKLYAEQLIANVETRNFVSLQNTMPQDIPSLMLGYLNELNRDVTGDKFDDRTIHQQVKAIAWECIQQNYQPGSAKRKDVIAILAALGANDPEASLEYLENRLHLIQTIGSGKDQIRFCLDPLAEYLAGLHIVDSYNNNDGKWRSLFLKKADDLVKTGAQDTIKGFLLAVRDCYLSQIPDCKESDFVPQRLAKIAGFTPPVNTQIYTQSVMP
jgi:hypothetical protein